MVSMKQKALEPGLLAVFRWFVAARLVVLAAMALGQAFPAKAPDPALLGRRPRRGRRAADPASLDASEVR